MVLVISIYLSFEFFFDEDNLANREKIRYQRGQFQEELKVLFQKFFQFLPKMLIIKIMKILPPRRREMSAETRRDF